MLFTAVSVFLWPTVCCKSCVYTCSKWLW